MAVTCQNGNEPFKSDRHLYLTQRQLRLPVHHYKKLETWVHYFLYRIKNKYVYAHYTSTVSSFIFPSQEILMCHLHL
jgi:hypothetical protein